MRISVHLFARARDLAGAGVIMVDLPNNATVADLRQAVRDAYPALASLVNRCAVAVANEFANDTQALAADVEVALLPPVSGG